MCEDSQKFGNDIAISTAKRHFMKVSVGALAVSLQANKQINNVLYKFGEQQTNKQTKNMLL